MLTGQEISNVRMSVYAKYYALSCPEKKARNLRKACLAMRALPQLGGGGRECVGEASQHDETRRSHN